MSEGAGVGMVTERLVVAELVSIESGGMVSGAFLCLALHKADCFHVAGKGWFSELLIARLIWPIIEALNLGGCVAVEQVPAFTAGLRWVEVFECVLHRCVIRNGGC